MLNKFIVQEIKNDYDSSNYGYWFGIGEPLNCKQYVYFLYVDQLACVLNPPERVRQSSICVLGE